MRHVVRWAAILAAVVMLPVVGFAQEQEAETVRMTVHPASPPVPALRYTFRPDLTLETSGNAATLYKEVATEIGDLPDEVEEWRQLPPDQLPIEQVRGLLDEYLPPQRWEKLVAASLCREVDWEVGLRQKGMQALLPHLRSVRDLTRLIALRAQVQMRDGDYASAVATLTVGFKLAEDVQSDPLLIEAVVAEGINRLMLEHVGMLQRMDNAPNLYWALADLPRPLVSIHEAVRRERHVAEFTFPALRRVRSGEEITEEEFHLIMGRLAGVISPLQPDHKPDADESERIAAATAMAIAPARAYFRKQGWTERQLDDLAEYELVARYMIETYDAAYDDLIKWTLLPYWHGFERLREQAERPGARIEIDMRSNVLMVFTPPFSRAWMRSVALDRELAAMQIVEGLRAYAAANDGQLPDSLEDLADTPAPLDPSTGQPFGYRVEGRTAVIESPLMAGGGKELRYEVTVVAE